MSLSPLDIYYHTTYQTCPKNENYIASASGLSTISHSAVVVLLPMYIFGGYCILTKTPATMKDVKWPMFLLHFWSSYVDILACTLITPYFYFPAVAAVPLGLFTYIGVPTLIQLYTALTSVFLMLVTMSGMFENRFNGLPQNRFTMTRPITKFIYYGVRISFIMIYPIFMMSHVPEQNQAKLDILKMMPCPTEEFFRYPVFVLINDPELIIFYFVISAVVIFVEIILIVGYHHGCKHYLFIAPNFVSPQTRKLQVVYFFSTTVQILVPLVFLFFPALFVAIAFFHEYYNQTITNLCVLTFSIHGCIACIVMLLIHKPYRDFVLQPFRRKQIETKSNTRHLKTSEEPSATNIVAS